MKILGSAASNVGRVLLHQGAMTPIELAAQLELTSAAIRKHLDTLTEAGLVECSERAPYGPGALSASRGRGRPARVFSLTAKGRATFGTRQESLALSAVKYLDQQGSDAVREFARTLANSFIERNASIMQLPTIQERVEALVGSLDQDGYAAEISQGLGESTQICQHHCPIGDVAAEYPQLCEEETKMISKLTGVHVTRLATIAKGAPICTTLVPLTRRDTA